VVVLFGQFEPAALDLSLAGAARPLVRCHGFVHYPVSLLSAGDLVRDGAGAGRGRNAAHPCSPRSGTAEQLSRSIVRNVPKLDGFGHGQFHVASAQLKVLDKDGDGIGAAKDLVGDPRVEAGGREVQAVRGSERPGIRASKPGRRVRTRAALGASVGDAGKEVSRVGVVASFGDRDDRSQLVDEVMGVELVNPI
jgi:hypothetical protein